MEVHMFFQLIRTITNVALFILPSQFNGDADIEETTARLLFVTFKKRQNLHVGSDAWTLTINLFSLLKIDLKIHTSRIDVNRGWETLNQYIRLDWPKRQASVNDDIPF